MNVREPNSPCRDQSEKSIKNWLRSNIKVGTVVAVRRVQDGMLSYERAVVLSIRPKNFNVGVRKRDGTFEESGITFDLSGKTWGESAVPMRLVVPTPAVLQACDVCDFGARFMPGKSGHYVCSVP